MLFKCVIVAILVPFILIISINLLPQGAFPGFPLDPVSFDAPDYEAAFESSIKWNDILSNKSEQLLLNQINGPESMAQRDNLLYTGLADGRLIEINLDNLKIKDITRFTARDKKTGKLPDQSKCVPGYLLDPLICGRPLGMRFRSDGQLIVIDGRYGLFRVNVWSGAFSSVTEYLPEGFYNDVVLDPRDDSVAYVTISTTKWLLDRSLWSTLEHENSGMVVRVNLDDGKVTTVISGLFFPNGIEISPDKRHLLVSEFAESKVWMVDLNDIRSGGDPVLTKKQLFAINFPGEPDNIRVFNGAVYIAFPLVRYQGKKTPLDSMSRLPLIRRTVGRLCYVFYKIMDLMYVLTPWEAIRDFGWKFYSGHIFLGSIQPYSAVGVFDGQTGSLKKIFGSESFATISEAMIDQRNGDMYFGSFANKFLGKIKAEFE